MPPLQLEDLNALDDVGAVRDGRTLLLAIDLIDEDPAQPRVEFDPTSLAELAASIALRGVLQPVSVRRHPGHGGRWLLNFGARRLRATRLAGRAEIPAFEDDVADDYVQVVENEQREGLTPLELALFVARRLGGGESQAEIARCLGKSASYVTYATALIDAPDWLMAIYRDGRCRGLRELYELRRLHATEPSAVAQWTSRGGPLTRDALAQLKTGSAKGAAEPANTLRPSRSESSSPLARNPATTSLEAEWLGETVTIVIDAVPSVDGEIYVRRENGARRAVPAAELTLRRIVTR